MDSIDDKEDMQFADEAFDILGFSSEEKYNVYKVRICFFNILVRPAACDVSRGRPIIS